jgi:hypothetical protein
MAAAVALTVLWVVGACQEHIPAYALASDDAGADALPASDATPDVMSDAEIPADAGAGDAAGREAGTQAD